MGDSNLPRYTELFCRNIGIVSEEEQSVLSRARVGIAGLGGVGGAHALTLARMGIGHFHISDMDQFEPANFNRQWGAGLSTVNRPKTDVIAEMIRDINPMATVKLFSQGISAGVLPAFLDSLDIVMDGIDAFSVAPRRLLHRGCHERGIYAVASGPVGLTATLHVFGPGSMNYEDYFDFQSCKTPEEELAAFLVGTCPSLLHRGQIDPRSINFAEKRGPSISAAINLCAGIAAVEVMQILTKRGHPFLAPRYFQFDAGRRRMVKRYLLWGNRNPLQRLKRSLVVRSALNEPGTHLVN